jgi:RNA polymerase sigma factor (sigma-70 family)
MLFSVSDETLISKALDGSQHAWVKLVARHEKQVYNYCLRMTGNRHDAMDLMQEVFVSIYRHLPSFRGQARFTTWMLRITANKSIDFLRARSRSPQQSLDEMEETKELPFTAPTQHDPDRVYEAQRHNQEIRVLLGQLGPEQRLVVELKFFQHCTFEEISYQTGVPVNTVKTRLYSALQKLRTQLEAQHVV